MDFSCRYMLKMVYLTSYYHYWGDNCQWNWMSDSVAVIC